MADSRDHKRVSDGYLLIISDIGVTADWVVTPNGHAPIGISQWIVTDMTRTDARIPAWAIFWAILLSFACLIGLLFLFAVERKTTGFVAVTVRAGDLYHVAQIPVTHPSQVEQIRAMVRQAQDIAAHKR